MILAAGCGGEPSYDLKATRACLEEATVGVGQKRPPAGQFPGTVDGIAFNLILQSRATPPTSRFILFADDGKGAKRAEEWARAEIGRLSGPDLDVPLNLLKRKRNVLISFIAPGGLPSAQRDLVEGCLTT